jgi:hypothetical protein
LASIPKIADRFRRYADKAQRPQRQPNVGFDLLALAASANCRELRGQPEDEEALRVAQTWLAA